LLAGAILQFLEYRHGLVFLGEELLTLGLQTAGIQPGQGLTSGNGIPFIYEDGDDGATGLKAQAAAASGEDFADILAGGGVAPYGLGGYHLHGQGRFLYNHFPGLVHPEAGANGQRYQRQGHYPPGAGTKALFLRLMVCQRRLIQSVSIPLLWVGQVLGRSIGRHGGTYAKKLILKKWKFNKFVFNLLPMSP
jgi:hypothetical protein